MSADVLRAAATKLREAATWAVCQCGGPICNVEQGWFREGELLQRFDGSEGAVPFLLLANPVFGLAVADWLDDMARAMVGTSYGDLPFEHRALAVARSIVGDPS